MLNSKACEGQQGFLLAEVLTAIAIGLVISLLLGPTFSRYETYLARMQLWGAARELAADLNTLQQRALFQAGEDEEADGKESLSVSNLLDGYAISRQGKEIRRVSFSKEGAGAVYFTSSSPMKLHFGPEGSPVLPGSSNCYKLVHKAQANLAINVRIQPVTGRVVISE
ncbi:MAG: hypothetical protein LKF34_06175 [Acidaminococcaceae bacterium]|jgi:Tfp pilus assembly major pilin PilA|nr:hypothetical protein [Acidaminococcaceae bacterium]